jgi:hypothetical protein
MLIDKAEFARKRNPVSLGKNGLAALKRGQFLQKNASVATPLNNPSGAKGQANQKTPQQKAKDKADYLDEFERLRPPQTPPQPTSTEIGNAQGDTAIAKKARVAKAETQRLRDKYANSNLPLVSPAVNYVSNKLIDKFGANEAAVVGTLGGLTVAPLAAGALLYQNHKTKEAEKEKQAQAQAHRDKVQEIIAKRNLLLEQRQAQAQQPQTQVRVPYNFFSAAPLVTPANFAFPKIGVRNPFFIKKEKALPLAAIGGTLVAGYGLLSKLNKQRALDAYKVNSLKDKNAQDFAANYFDSPQYHADNLIREAASITGNPLLQGITDNPLDRLTPAQQAEVQKRRGTARYSRGADKVANFFDPLITPSLAIGGTLYGIYNKKKAADQQEEVFEAQKLAALGSIKDRSLRQQLLAKAQGQFIDEDSKNRIIDSALNGDVRSVLRTGLKKVNWDAL